MTDFIDTKFTFLTDAQRQLLRDADLDSHEAFAHLTVGELVAAGLKLGTASKVLVAAGVKSTATEGPQTVVITHAEPPDVSARIDRALQIAHDDPSKAGALVDLGVLQVVLQADDKIDLAATKAMRAHAATGAPVGVTWQGQRIADTATLASPPVWCSPRTGEPLQAGQDERTGIAWGELKLDGLRLAAFGYEGGVFGGASDEYVFGRIRDDVGGIRAKLETRMKARGFTPQDMDRVVVYKRGKSDPTDPTQVSDGDIKAMVNRWLTDMTGKHGYQYLDTYKELGLGDDPQRHPDPLKDRVIIALLDQRVRARIDGRTGELEVRLG